MTELSILEFQKILFYTAASLEQIVTPQSVSTNKMNEYVEPYSPIKFFNAPFTTWMYSNHETKNDYVCIAVPIFSGSRNVNFTLSSDGMKVIIHYVWPAALYTPSLLFAQATKDGQLQQSDPKVLAFTSQMLRDGYTENSLPSGNITIELPCQVKREINSFKYEALTVDGTNIVLLEFTVYKKSLFVDDADTTLNFD